MKDYKPHKYQQEVLDFMDQRNYAGLLLEPSLGKTSIMLKHVVDKGLKALLIAPVNICATTWPSEILQWSMCAGLKYEFLHGTKKEIALYKLYESSADIIAITPDALEWFFSHPNVIKKLGLNTLIVDELTKFKNTGSKRFKLLKPNLAKFEYRYGLTGSFVANSLINAYGQMYVLDMGAALGKTKAIFEALYFNKVLTLIGNQKYVYTHVERDNSATRMADSIKGTCITLSAKDNIDLPELHVNNIIVGIDDKIKKMYNTIIKELVITLQDSNVPIAHKSGALFKAQQVLAGAVYIDDVDTNTRRIEALHSAKIDALESLVDELNGEQLFIGYKFKFEVDMLKAKFGSAISFIGSNVAANITAENIAKWNDKKIILLAGNPSSVSHGLNLHLSGCRHICYTNLPYDYEVYDQFYRRVYRQNNGNARVVLHRLIVNNSLDQDIAKVLDDKGAMQDLFLSILDNNKTEGL